MKKKIIKELSINRQSQRIELMIYDLNENEEEYIKYLNTFLENIISNESLINELFITDKDEILLNILKKYKKNLYSFDINLLTQNINSINLDRNKLRLTDIEILLSQKINNVKILEDELNIIKSINKTDVFILNWKPSNKIFKDSDITKFNNLKEEILNTINSSLKKENDKRKSQNLKELSGAYYLDFISKFTKKLNEYKSNLLKKYNLKININTKFLDNEISNGINQINNLISLKNRKLKLILLWIKAKNKIIKKKIKSKSNTNSLIKYSNVDNFIINQIVNSYKLVLLKNYIKKKKINSTITRIIEIIDYINYILSKNLIDKNDHSRLLNYYLYSVLIYYIKLEDYINLNNYFYSISFKIINKKIGINANSLNDLVNNWPKYYKKVGNKELDTLLLKLTSNKSPSDYYNKNIILEVDNYLTNPLSNNKKLIKGVIYDPESGKYDTTNGYLFNVFFFEKDPKTGNPIEISNIVETKIPKSGRTIAKNVNILKEGKIPFIKIKQFNPDNQREIIEVFKEIPKIKVKNYPIDYDTCNNISEKDCNNSKGLGNYPCNFVNNKCINTFNK